MSACRMLGATGNRRRANRQAEGRRRRARARRRSIRQGRRSAVFAERIWACVRKNGIARWCRERRCNLVDAFLEFFWNQVKTNNGREKIVFVMNRILAFGIAALTLCGSLHAATGEGAPAPEKPIVN